MNSSPSQVFSLKHKASFQTSPLQHWQVLPWLQERRWPGSFGTDSEKVSIKENQKSHCGSTGRETRKWRQHNETGNIRHMNNPLHMYCPQNRLLFLLWRVKMNENQFHYNLKQWASTLNLYIYSFTCFIKWTTAGLICINWHTSY